MTAHNTEQLRHAAAVLEWPKVLARLGEFASSEPGRDACLELSFQETPEGARRACRRTAEAAVFAREGQFAPLADLTRLDRELGRLRAGGTLTAEELRRTALVYQASRLVRTLILDRWEDVPVLAELGAALIEDLGLEREILGAIDEEGHVADQASPELAKLRARYRDIHKRIYETMQKLVTRSEFVDHLQDDFFTLRGGRYVLVVKIEKQGKVEGIVHDISGSGQSLFIEPREITQLNNVLRNTELDIDREIRRILEAFSHRVAAHRDDLARAVDALVEIDVAFAAARYALFLNAHEPEIAEEGETHLEALRHPLLVGRGFDVVANDVTLEASARCVLITGPNAGGKTVLLKALGLALLMTRAGLHPPAGPGSRVADWGGVHAIIGDEQSIEAGLSTFAAMLASLKTILDAAAPGGLVLLDEIGEGTDPRQGVALSMAVLERLAERGVRTIATTHFAELAAMAEARDGFVNASMEFDRERMAPTYRLRLGVPGRSGAFDVAAKMGLDPAIVARARELYEGASSELDEIMEGMDATMRDLEERRREAERDRAEARRLLDLQRDRLKELEERMKKQAASSLRAVESEYETARERIREAVAALQRGPTFQTADEARKTIDENVVRARRVTPPQTERADEPGEPVRGPLEDGDRVWVRTLRAWGRAEGPADAKGRVRVTVGGARVESTVEDLRAGERKAEAPAVHVRTPVLGSESAGADERTLDLRGERSDDARDRVSEFLDAAYRSRWDRVTIVHGHGTGVLKKEVRDMLRGAPYRMNFRPGERGEGGDGATVVEFEFV